jgi:hypothetical protein
MSTHKTKTPPRDISQPPKQPHDAALDQELEDSFPASDPPQSTQPHVKTGGPRRAQGHAKDKAPTRERQRSRASCEKVGTGFSR